MSRRQQVFVVTWERCLGSENGETCGVVGVYRTEAAAFKALDREVQEWRQRGSVVACYFAGLEGDENGNWDVSINMRTLPLEG